MTDLRCFFHHWPGAGECDGQLIRAHLIPQQTLRRECGKGWRALADDARSWVPCCGGPTGIGGHHGRLDHSRTLRIPFDALPFGFVQFCEEIGLGWYVTRTYPKEANLS